MSLKEYKMRKDKKEIDPATYEKLVRGKLKNATEEENLYASIRSDMMTVAVGCIHMVETHMGALWDHPGALAPPPKGYEKRFLAMREEIFDRVNIMLDKWKDKLIRKENEKDF